LPRMKTIRCLTPEQAQGQGERRVNVYAGFILPFFFRNLRSKRWSENPQVIYQKHFLYPHLFDVAIHGMVWAFKDLEAGDKDTGNIGESLLRVDRLAQDMSIPVINVLVIAGCCFRDVKALILIERKRLLISSLDMQVRGCDVAVPFT